MQIIVTDAGTARTRVLNVAWWQLLAVGLVSAALALALSGTAYHFALLKGAFGGWPVAAGILPSAARDEVAQRDRFMRQNLDAMALKLGELQAKLMKLDAVGERVSGLAGLKPEDLSGLDRKAAPLEAAAAARAATGGARKPAQVAAAPAAEGGPYLPLSSPTLAQLDAALAAIDQDADQRSDVFTLVESRLLESRLASLMVPSSAPVAGSISSGFGVRFDPFTGRGALHMGLDFPADTGTPIEAAAGGVVLSAQSHPAYGLLVEVDHGNALVTRYAHASKLLVKAGDIVRRGQAIAEVGSTGRSTGPHLHFEVLLDGVQQNPARFLAQGAAAAAASGARKGVGGSLRVATAR